MKYFTALDVSLRTVSICIIDDQGSIRFESKIDSDVDKIIHCIQNSKHKGCQCQQDILIKD